MEKLNLMSKFKKHNYNKKFDSFLDDGEFYSSDSDSSVDEF